MTRSLPVQQPRVPLLACPIVADCRVPLLACPVVSDCRVPLLACPAVLESSASVMAGLRVLVTILVLMLVASPAWGESPDAVTAGREALKDGQFTWYNAPKDELRRLEVEREAKPSNFDFNLGPVTTFLPYFFLIAIIVLLVGVLVWFFRNRDLLPAVETERLPGTRAITPVDRIEALPLQLDRKVDNLLAEAERQYQAGNYQQAMIYLYGHELVSLDQQQLIRLTKGKTNRQYLRELTRSGPPELTAILERSLVTFEEVFFGNHALEREQFERCWQQVAEFERRLREVAS